MPASVRELEKIVPSGSLSEHMVRLLARTLRLPVVYRLGDHLGTTALESATAPISPTFNAGGSSIYKDLERLVLSSYIATVAEAFVVYTSKATALPVTTLIVVPTLVLGALVLSIKAWV
ncbi:hypothetical protein B0H67DRAFT_686793 [Lasiosphaeris hirsuta]|uniref:Uncharacterized protein n=1 Tax=Lasiosphaeris hirsuta TaxID=260670 RepID=A0AA39ZVA9_9PEZI|nr:hypothetical protein B0H67DRAFT_686793 [Lasiosphaeris hirsuta]